MRRINPGSAAAMAQLLHDMRRADESGRKPIAERRSGRQYFGWNTLLENARPGDIMEQRHTPECGPECASFFLIHKVADGYPLAVTELVMHPTPQ